MREKELMIFRGLREEPLLARMSAMMSLAGSQGWDRVERQEIWQCVGELLELAAGHGFRGNIWHCYLANLLVNHENVYSCSCEIRGEVPGSLNDAVLHDMEIIRELVEYDFSGLQTSLGIREWSLVENFKQESPGKIYNKRISDRICDLALHLAGAANGAEMKKTLTAFYKEYGVGRFGLHKAFRVEREAAGVRIVPIMNIAHVRLDDLVGYEIAKKKLIDNTEAFVAGRRANNCLLYGDAGTGKSSSIKAIANAYYDRGLRMIEVYKHQFRDLNEVIGQIKNRNYKFIIYMDDLSFEEFETEYKYLKAVIEGGLEKKPDNVLIYATSNRRHLIRESFRDKEEIRQDMHTGDTVQEKLSLVARFGVTIYFGAPEKREFEEIVLNLARREQLPLPEDELLKQAGMWELGHGGRSGRCARQFIDYLMGSRSL